MRHLLALPLLALIAACGPIALPGAAPDPVATPAGIAAAPGAAPAGADTCGKAQFAPLIGLPVGDGAALRAAGVTFRVIYPGDAITEDFMPARLNVYVDAPGTITSLECF